MINNIPIAVYCNLIYFHLKIITNLRQYVLSLLLNNVLLHLNNCYYLNNSKSIECIYLYIYIYTVSGVQKIKDVISFDETDSENFHSCLYSDISFIV